MDREIGIPAFELREGADLLFLFPGDERIGGMSRMESKDSTL